MHVTLELDDEANALYLRIGEGEAARTETFEAPREVLIDFDAEGQVIGIEVLDPDGFDLDQTLNIICSRYHLPDLRKFVTHPPGKAVGRSVA